MVVHNQGTEVFDQNMSLLHAKAEACISRVETELHELMLNPGNHNVHVIDLSESDGSEDSQMAETSRDGGRKRKEPLSSSKEPRMKQVKLNHLGSDAEDGFSSFSSGGSDSDGLFKDVDSDDDMDLA